MKVVCILLSLIVAILGGVLMYTVQAGHLPMQTMPQEVAGEVASSQESTELDSPLISSQIGLVDELVESLQVANEELNSSKLRLDKREKDLQELYATYLKLRKETNRLIAELENGLIDIEEGELKNFKKLAGVYSNMEPSSAAQSLKHMESERVALILNQMDSRSMAAIMDEAVSTSVNGSEFVAEWSDAIRRLNDEGDKL